MPIERFEIGERVGKGASATVHRARDRQTGATVALKLLHEVIADNEVSLARFRREADILGELSHPNVVKLVAAGVAPPFLAMEWVEGPTLAAEIARRAGSRSPFSVEECLALVEGLASGLDAVHARGFVHRDVKPANIALASGVPRLLDFGVAHLLDVDAHEGTTQGRVIGSWIYMSPEQVRGSGVEPRSDQFALASVVFELLSLTQAWARDKEGRPRSAAHAAPRNTDGNRPTDIAPRILFEAPPKLLKERPGLLPEVQAVLERAWSKAPADRFPTTSDFALALAVSLQGRGRPESMPPLLTAAAPTERARLEATRSSVLPAPDATRSSVLPAPDAAGGAAGEATRSSVLPADAARGAAGEATWSSVLPPADARLATVAPLVEPTRGWTAPLGEAALPNTPSALPAHRPSDTPRGTTPSSFSQSVPRRDLVEGRRSSWGIAALALTLAALSLTVLWGRPEAQRVELPLEPPPAEGPRAIAVPSASELPPATAPPTIEPEAEPPPKASPRPRPRPPQVEPPAKAPEPSKPAPDPLDRLIAQVSEAPRDLDRLRRLDEALRARAAQLPAGPQRTRIERCATMATVAGDGAALLGCAAQLPR